MGEKWAPQAKIFGDFAIKMVKKSNNGSLGCGGLRRASHSGGGLSHATVTQPLMLPPENLGHPLGTCSVGNFPRGVL